jgi:hypothetical protein
MSRLGLESLVAAIPELDLHELRTLEMAVGVAIRIRSQGELSTETARPRLSATDEGPGLDEQALVLLEGVDTYDLSLADQALLAATVLSEGYRQESFSSRDVNDVIDESGRPRIAHITSAITALLEKSYLEGSTKALSLTREGKAKARGLIGMLRRRAAA